MRELSFDLIENFIAAPEEDHSCDPVHRRLAAAAGMIYREELTRQQQECIRLCIIGGQTRTAAAHILGISPQAVSRHVQKGMQRIEHILQYCRL